MSKRKTDVESKILSLLSQKKTKYSVFEANGTGESVHCRACNKRVNVQTEHESECLNQHQEPVTRKWSNVATHTHIYGIQ